MARQGRFGPHSPVVAAAALDSGHLRRIPERLHPALARLIDQFERLPGIGHAPPSGWPCTCCASRRSRSAPSPRRCSRPAARWGVPPLFPPLGEPECEICRQEERRNGLLCVVADSRDLLAMERTREYRGTYHVLGGLISPMDGIGPEARGSSRWWSGSTGRAPGR